MPATDIMFDIATLQGVVRALPQPKLGFAAKYFTRVVESADAEIHFDVEGTDLRMAPFVSPLVPGKIVEGTGFATKTFRPAYIKDKTPFTAARALTRRLGEQIGGEFDPEQRLALDVATELSEKLLRLERRLEWMAVQALYNGRVTVQGDQYPTTVVDFGRAPGNTVVRTSGNKWGDSGVSPIEDLHQWSGMAETPISDYYMTRDAYTAFRKDPDTWKRLELMRGSSTLDTDAVLSRDLVLMGMIDGFRIWVIPAINVTNEDGSTSPLVPDGTVIGVADAYFEGVRHFGAIQDVNNLKPGSYFVKSWVEEDPSVRYLMLQSAPLLVPYRPNSTFRATVR